MDKHHPVDTVDSHEEVALCLYLSSQISLTINSRARYVFFSSTGSRAHCTGGRVASNWKHFLGRISLTYHLVHILAAELIVVATVPRVLVDWWLREVCTIWLRRCVGRKTAEHSTILFSSARQHSFLFGLQQCLMCLSTGGSKKWVRRSLAKYVGSTILVRCFLFVDMQQSSVIVAPLLH